MRYLATFFVLGLISCAMISATSNYLSDIPTIPKEVTPATIHICRVGVLFGDAVPVHIYYDNIPIFRLGIDVYTSFLAMPGSHSISIDGGPLIGIKMKKINCVPGADFFFRVTTSEIFQLSPDEWDYYVEKCEPLAKRIEKEQRLLKLKEQ